MSGKGCDCVCHKLGYVSCIGHCDRHSARTHHGTQCACDACTYRDVLGNAEERGDTYSI